MNKIGERTIVFKSAPFIAGNGGVGGKEEKCGPVGDCFDVFLKDDLWGEKSWELTEKKMHIRAIVDALNAAGLYTKDIDVMLGGDLLNQIITAGYSARELGIPFLGLYGACSTMSESLAIGAMAVDGGYAKNVVCAASSHFATAERQFRYPLELGTPKTPTSQHTATASGATVISMKPINPGAHPRITCATIGRVVDYGIKDVNNMGAAMAPAAAETLFTHFYDTKRKPSYYDLILSGDLGIFGKEILIRMAEKEKMDLSLNYTDCGVEIYKGMDNMYCGGSGCGLSALMLNKYYIPKMREGKLKRILFMATGALMSPTSSLQGESIPAIAHAISIEMENVKWNI